MKQLIRLETITTKQKQTLESSREIRRKRKLRDGNRKRGNDRTGRAQVRTDNEPVRHVTPAPCSSL